MGQEVPLEGSSTSELLLPECTLHPRRGTSETEQHGGKNHETLRPVNLSRPKTRSLYDPPTHHIIPTRTHTHTQTQTQTHTDRQTDRQPGRQADRHAHTETHTPLLTHPPTHPPTYLHLPTCTLPSGYTYLRLPTYSKQMLTPHLTSKTPPTLSTHFSTHLRFQPPQPPTHKAPPKTHYNNPKTKQPTKTKTTIHNTTQNQSNYPTL